MILRVYDRIFSPAEVEGLYLSYQNPIIRTNGEHNATVGTNFSLSLAADNAPTTYLAEGLPAGLSLNTTTGQITGSLSQPGYHRVFVKAMNEHGTNPILLLLLLEALINTGGPLIYPMDLISCKMAWFSGLMPIVDADGEFDGLHRLHETFQLGGQGMVPDHNFLQATAFRQPTIRSGQISEKPNLSMLVFEGNQSLEFPSINHCRTLFWVMNKGQGYDERGSFIGKVGEITPRGGRICKDTCTFRCACTNPSNKERPSSLGRLGGKHHRRA